MEDILLHENILLMTLGFDFNIELPNIRILKFCDLIQASKEFRDLSCFLAVDSFILTTMCLEHKPEVVSCVCVHFACKLSNFEIPQNVEGKAWYLYFDATITQELLHQLTNDFDSAIQNCTSKIKNNINALKDNPGRSFAQGRKRSANSKQENETIHPKKKSKNQEEEFKNQEEKQEEESKYQANKSMDVEQRTLEPGQHVMSEEEECALILISMSRNNSHKLQDTLSALPPSSHSEAVLIPDHMYLTQDPMYEEPHHMYEGSGHMSRLTECSSKSEHSIEADPEDVDNTSNDAQYSMQCDNIGSYSEVTIQNNDCNDTLSSRNIPTGSRATNKRKAHPYEEEQATTFTSKRKCPLEKNKNNVEPESSDSESDSKESLPNENINSDSHFQRRMSLTSSNSDESDSSSSTSTTSSSSSANSSSHLSIAPAADGDLDASSPENIVQASSPENIVQASSPENIVQASSPENIVQASSPENIVPTMLESVEVECEFEHDSLLPVSPIPTENREEYQNVSLIPPIMYNSSTLNRSMNELASSIPRQDPFLNQHENIPFSDDHGLEFVYQPYIREHLYPSYFNRYFHPRPEPCVAIHTPSPFHNLRQSWRNDFLRSPHSHLVPPPPPDLSPIHVPISLLIENPTLFHDMNDFRLIPPLQFPWQIPASDRRGHSSNNPLSSGNNPLPSGNNPLPSSNNPLPSSNNPLPSSNNPLPSSNNNDETFVYQPLFREHIHRNFNP